MASLIRRLEPLVWYIFLATLAWQTRIILWQADPVFWEWRSASLWATDVLMVGLFATALVQGWRPRLRSFDAILGFLFAAAVLSLGNADHLGIGLYQLARLAQYAVLYLYLRQYAFGRFDAVRSVTALLIGAATQAALGIAQFYAQHDLGFRLIGETLLGPDMRGVAVFYDLAHERVLRAYGTLPHPNVLAAYLMVALSVALWLWHRGRSRFAAVAGALLLWALYLTFSRTMIVAWGGAFLAVLIATWRLPVVRRSLLQAAVLTTVISTLFLAVHWELVWARMTVAASDESVRLRVRYAQDAVSSGGGTDINVNWTGVGLGNFTTWLMRYDDSMPRFMYQPTHNVYLLAYAEIGLAGVVAWLAWLVLASRAGWRWWASHPELRVGIFALAGAFLFIGLFDHFFWSLQQGRIIWWLLLALAAGPEKRLTG